MSRKRIGELLLERQAISKEQLEVGLAAQSRTRQRLGLTLVQQGVISEIQLAIVLAQSLDLGSVDLSKAQVDWSAVHMLRAGFCEQHELFPFGIEGKGTPTKRLMLAMADPLNTGALAEVEFTTGLRAAVRVATHSHVRDAIRRYYHKGNGTTGAGLPMASTATPIPAPAPAAAAAVSSPKAAQSGPPDPELEQLIALKQRQGAAPKKRPAGVSDDVARDLEFLLGSDIPGDDLAVEALEKKFWVLMRIMARKGLITREEFMKELDGEE